MVLHFIYHHKKFSEVKKHYDVTSIFIEGSRFWFYTNKGAYSVLLSKVSDIKVWEFSFDDEK